MVFSSVEFILYFLPAFFLAYGITPAKYRNVTLLAGSLIFYALGEPRFLALLVLSVLVNFLLGLHLGQGNRNLARKRLLIAVGIIGNTALLVAFKVGMREGGIPLGISYYTFQMLSYLIDIYRGENQRERSFVKFAAYVIMFPQLTAGPIVKYGEVRTELGLRKLKAEKLQDGLGTFVVGLSYKVLLADRIGLLWHEVQVTGIESISTPLAWVAAIAYSMKIYFDFYGYSLMAIGLGRMLGFELPENFRTPYMAHSVREFYRRWHITLSRWFCSYVYIPLGGNRKGELRTIFNLLVVWLLTSVWHGDTLNFLLWGGILAFCIILERQLHRLAFIRHCKVLPRLYLWTVIPITWMCFANTDFTQLCTYLGKMFGMNVGVSMVSTDWQSALWNYSYLFVISFICCTGVVQRVYDKWKHTIVGKLVLAVLLWISVGRLIVEGNNPFMYFRF